jgi:hypothetical protein
MRVVNLQKEHYLLLVQLYLINYIFLNILTCDVQIWFTRLDVQEVITCFPLFLLLLFVFLFARTQCEVDTVP